MNQPEPTEYPPHYQKYIDLAGDRALLQMWDENTREIADFFTAVSAEKQDYRYAVGKWTIKDVLMHLADSERGYSYRAIVCVRGDQQTPLYPMDEDLFAANVDTGKRTMQNIVDEFLAIRHSFKKIYEYSSLQEQAQLGNGINGKISARALGYIAIGHSIHHMNVVKERYL